MALSKEKLQKLQNNMEQIADAFKEVEDMWIEEDADEMNRLLVKEYPFDDSFDDLTLKVIKWCDTSIQTIWK